MGSLVAGWPIQARLVMPAYYCEREAIFLNVLLIRRESRGMVLSGQTLCQHLGLSVMYRG